MNPKITTLPKPLISLRRLISFPKKPGKLAQSLKLIGLVYSDLGDFEESSDYYFQSLKLYEQINDREGTGNALSCVASVYFDQKNYDKALEYYFRALNIAKETNDCERIAAGLNDIAAVYGNLEEYEKVTKYLEDAVKINKELGNKRAEAINYTNLGVINQRLQNYDEALVYFLKALNIFNDLNHILLIANFQIVLSAYYLEVHNPDLSIEYAKQAYKAGKKHGLKKVVYDAAEMLHNPSPYGFTSFGEVEDYTVIISGGSSSAQLIELNVGYQFVSSRIEAENSDMLVVLQDILNENLDFVRSSDGAVLRKIGPNWVNGIGDWITTEGYLIKMYGAETLALTGDVFNPLYPINLTTGYQFVSFLPETAIDAIFAFEGILTDDLDYIRNSQGEMLRKIGYTWVNGLGDANPGEGYLIKMFADDELVYNIPVKSTLSSLTPEIVNNFAFEGGNAAEPVYTMYVSGLNIGDEVAVFDNKKIVGTSVITSNNALENSIPVFSTISTGQGYKSGNEVTLKVWDAQSQTIVSATYTFNKEYSQAYTKTEFPTIDGEFSVINVTKGAIETEKTALTEVSIYPNPATDVLNIVSNNTINRVRILNSVGQIMFDSELNNTILNVNTTNYQSGIYFIQLETNDGIITEKVTIK